MSQAMPAVTSPCNAWRTSPSPVCSMSPLSLQLASQGSALSCCQQRQKTWSCSYAGRLPACASEGSKAPLVSPAIAPASSRALLSTLLTLPSKASIRVRPGCGSSLPVCRTNHQQPCALWYVHPYNPIRPCPATCRYIVQASLETRYQNSRPAACMRNLPHTYNRGQGMHLAHRQVARCTIYAPVYTHLVLLDDALHVLLGCINDGTNLGARGHISHSVTDANGHAVLQ